MRPPQLKNVIERPRLIDRMLDESDKPIIVICADAGYGKTTLAAQYLQACGARPAWYRLDRSDCRARVFAAYLETALAGPDSGTSCEASYLDLGSLDPESAARTLVARLESLVDSPTVLVLDDFHAVDQVSDVCTLMRVLLDNLPENLRVLIVTRQLAGTSMARRLAAGRVLRLETQDLAFMQAETATLWAAAAADASGRTGEAQTAWEVSAGWAAGLMLLREWLSRGNRIEDASPAALAGHGTIYDYLAHEVFECQNEYVRRFLLDTCVLDEISEREAGQMAKSRILSEIEGRGLFFRRTFDSPLTLACHPLFSEFLRRRLVEEKGPQAVAERHAWAAKYFAESGDIDRAVSHAIISDDEAVIEEVAQLCASAIAIGWRADLAGQLARCPKCVSRSSAVLALRGFALQVEGSPEAALTVLEEALSNPDSRGSDTAQCLVLEQLSIAYADLGDSIRAAQVCADALQMLNSELHSSAAGASLHMRRGYYLVRAGQGSIGLESAAAGMQTLRSCTSAERADMLSRYGLALLLAGDPVRARPHVVRAFEYSERHGLAACESWAASNVAAVETELGNYEAAYAQANIGLELASRSSTPWQDEAIAHESIAHLLLGMGDPGAARAELLLCLDAVGGGRDRQTEVTVWAGLAACARTQGCASEALRHANAMNARSWRNDAFLESFTKLANSAALIAVGEIEQARAELPKTVDAAGTPIFPQLETWSRFLRADIAFREGRLHNCDQHLRKALSLAAEKRYVHLLVVEGRIAPHLLSRAVESAVETEFAREILSRIGPWVLPETQRMLASEDERVALTAAEILGVTQRSWARRPLIEAVRDRRPRVSKSAAEALARLPVQQEEKLRVNALGEFSVLCGERKSLFKKRKAKYLMQYLFVNRDRLVARDVVVDTFWPDSDPRAAQNNFHVTFYAVKRALNPHLQRREQLPYFNLEDGCMQLVGKTYSSDVDDFLNCWQEAQRQHSDGRRDEAIQSLRRCQGLYRGDLMEDNLYEDWTSELRSELRDVCFRALGLLAELLDQERDHEEAARVLRKLISRDRTREELHVRLAEQYVKQGNRALAATQQKLCQRALADELGVELARDTRLAFERLLNKAAPVAGREPAPANTE